MLAEHAGFDPRPLLPAGVDVLHAHRPIVVPGVPTLWTLHGTANRPDYPPNLFALGEALAAGKERDRAREAYVKGKALAGSFERGQVAGTKAGCRMQTTRGAKPQRHQQKTGRGEQQLADGRHPQRMASFGHPPPAIATTGRTPSGRRRDTM